MSHFAGERPNLFEATQNPDGTLAVTLNGNAHYLVVRKGEARAKGIPEPPDPSRYTNVKNPTEPFRFSFPNLEGKTVSNTDALFQGKVVILSIGGSWCPNCHDEAPFLSELYRDYQARGLEIVGLMFENDPDPKVSIPRIRAFMRRHAVKYPMLLAGTTNPVADDQDHQRSPAGHRQLRRVPDGDLSGPRRPRAQRARRVRQPRDGRGTRAVEEGIARARRTAAGGSGAGEELSRAAAAAVDFRLQISEFRLIF